MRAVIRSPSGVNGNAVFQFLKDGSLSYSILLAVKHSDRVKNITLNGPARDGSVGPVILELTDYFIQDVTDFTWYANNTVQDKLTSELLLHLWQGHLYIDVKLEGDKENSRLISGQISRPGSWYCDKPQTFCPHMNLYLHGQKPDPGLQTVPTSAEAVFYVDRANALQYSIQVKFSNPHEVALSASVTEGQKTALTISKFKSNSLDNQHIHEVNGHLPQISPDMKKLLSEGKLKLVVSTSVNPNGDIVGDIPSVERPHCIKTSRFNVAWDLQNAPLDGLNVVVGDVVIFTYGQNETIYRLPNRIQYRSCDFSDARMVAAPLHPKMTSGQVQLDMKEPGEFYYASEQNCNNSLYMTVTVTENDTRPFKDCSRSAYQLWLDQKLSGRGGSGAVGAIIGGSFLAVVSLLLIALLDRRRKVRSKSSSGFQRF
ncbi:uncharacterized protein LOC135469134 [Liolophura sinensis]|uniref:uncharacterized protein LOC135469134 n=1 Tax=Liolophura sinensis TaxID=3198878 RepID=UPI0031586EED